VSKAVGDGLTRTQDGIVTWCATTRTLSLVESQTGAVRESRSLPDVVSMHATAATNGDLLMLTTDGRVQRCPPLHPIEQATPIAASEAPAAAKPSGEPEAPAEAAPTGN
jgi:hypothetical protein